MKKVTLGGVAGSAMSASATDPLNRLTRRVNRPENQLDSLRADNRTLKGCLGIDDVTQYDDYQRIGTAASPIGRLEI